MPLEAIINHPCRVKHDLGNGDLRAGTTTLLQLLHPPGRRSAALAPELEAHLPACTNCPVNALRRPFGCATSLDYPIAKQTERWLLDRIQPPDTIGGALCIQAIQSQPNYAEMTRGFRASGMLAAFPGLDHELPKNVFEMPELSADDLWPHLLAVEKLAPWQSLARLLWLGAVKHGDAIATTAADAYTLTRLEPTDRPRHAKLTLGPPDTDAATEQLRNVLKLLFLAWARNIEVVVRA